ncbi:ATP-binding protein [Methanococcoides methylutens]|uniref:ATP-binding protein n=1 Tax=Methanococcoides methylutens TaxID=2226 RepID=UPI000694648D|nr:ATP-binding protein [Methanococcoides methylutens]
MNSYSIEMNVPISGVPHGEHSTLLYQNDDDVLDFIFSFLESGFKRNDLCIWIKPGIKENEETDGLLNEKITLVKQNYGSSNFDLVLVNSNLLSNGKAYHDAILEIIENKQKYAVKNGFNGLRVNIDLIMDKVDTLPFLRECQNSIISSSSGVDLTSLFICSLDSFSSSDVIVLMDCREKIIMKKDGMWTYMVDLLSSKYRKHLRTSPELMKKEKELKSIYRKSPVVAFLRSSENGFPVEFVSENVSQFGYSAVDLMADKVLYKDIIHSEDVTDYFLAFSECIKKGKSEFTKEYRIIDRERNIRWVTETSLIELDDHRKAIRFQGIIVDITEKKLAEEALKKTELNFKTLFDHSNDAVFIYDLSGYIYEVNAKLCDWLGYTRATLLKKNIIETFSPECAAHFHECMVDFFHTGGCIFEMAHLRKDGSEIPIEMSAQLIEYNGNVAILSISRDITERKNVEHALLEAKTNAEASNNLKSEFLANMSHELRTPLNSIIGFSDVLLYNDEDLLNDEQIRFITNISKSGKHLLSLINDILDLSKIEAGKADLHYEVFIFLDMLNDVISIVSPLAQQKNLHLDTIIESDNFCINADKLKLKQIIFNLVTNAIKFTPKGGSVIIRVEKNTDLLVIKVEDTGIGIPKSAQYDLFKPFTQVDSASNRQFEGTGLGLSLVKKLVNMHGGNVWVESEPGVGSTFGFSVPLSLELP